MRDYVCWMPMSYGLACNNSNRLKKKGSIWTSILPHIYMIWYGLIVCNCNLKHTNTGSITSIKWIVFFLLGFNWTDFKYVTGLSSWWLIRYINCNSIKWPLLFPRYFLFNVCFYICAYIFGTGKLFLDAQIVLNMRIILI